MLIADHKKQKTSNIAVTGFYKMVRLGGLEPPRPKALPPQGSVSTNSTTSAFFKLLLSAKSACLFEGNKQLNDLKLN